MQIVWEDYLEREDLKRATETDIRSLEASLGHKLPASLKQIYMTHGGETPTNLVPLYPNGKQMVVDCIYHAFPDDPEDDGYTAPFTMSALADEGYFDLVPFSHKGNVFLCLDYSVAEDNPPVIMVLRDFVPKDPKHKYKLADSFDEFLVKYTVPLDQAPT